MATRLELDLAWLAAATPLMTSAFWAEHGVSPATTRHTGPGDGTDCDPVRQVGRWFERVHLCAMRSADGVEVLASNLALRNAGDTLGELDVVYRHAGQVVHREIAVKFYLAAKPGDDPSSWIGPGRRDRLDLKLGHLAKRQLTLPERARDEGAWPEDLPFPGRSEVLLLGALCSPSDDPRLPSGAETNAAQGRWYYAKEFAERFGDAPWAVLDKPWWLSPEHARQAPAQAATALAEELRSPRFVGRVGKAVERAFVVPDGWWSGI